MQQLTGLDGTFLANRLILVLSRLEAVGNPSGSRATGRSAHSDAGQ